MKDTALPKIVVAGGGGLIGKPLVQRLSQKYEVVRLRREVMDAWPEEVEGAWAVINLCGEPIAGKRWTQKQKKILRDSRILTTRAVIEAARKAKDRPKVLVNASAVGYYGARGGTALDESSSAGEGFLPGLCQEWEGEAKKAEALGTRVALVRTGIVLAKEGGALAKMLPPFRFFLGGPLGDGKQVLSWIHLEDGVNAIAFILENPSLTGPVNLTAPNPVTMKGFAQALGRVLRRPSCFPVPALVLKILLGEMSGMLLTGQNALPSKLLNHGFRFRFHRLEDALRDLLLSY